MIDCNLALEALGQRAATIIVQTATAHIDRLDSGGRCRLYGLVVAIANDEVIADDPLERREREHVGHNLFAVLVVDIENEAIIQGAKYEFVRAAVMVLENKRILVDQIVDCHLAFVVNVGVGAA